MEKSETIGELAKALATAQAKMPKLLKEHTATIPMKSGGKFSYQYASLADTMAVALPVLSANGISVVQSPGGDRGDQHLTTMLLHESGEWLSDTMPLFIAQNDAQGQGSAITYARRYMFSALVGIAPDEDDDGQAATDYTPTTRSTGTQPGSQAAKAGNPATDAQWKYLAKLTNQTVEQALAQYGEMNAAACSALIDGLKEAA